MSKHPWSKEELSLLRAIHELPRDDAPRLAYANWLEVNGQAQYGEFIRIQCQTGRVLIRPSQNHERTWD